MRHISTPKTLLVGQANCKSAYTKYKCAKLKFGWPGMFKTEKRNISLRMFSNSRYVPQVAQVGPGPSGPGDQAQVGPGTSGTQAQVGPGSRGPNY